MALHPFCANEKCLYHNQEVENDCLVLQVEDPHAGDFEVNRVLLDFKSSGRQFFYCECCWQAIAQVTGRADEPKPGLAYKQSLQASGRIARL